MKKKWKLKKKDLKKEKNIFGEYKSYKLEPKFLKDNNNIKDFQKKMMKICS